MTMPDFRTWAENVSIKTKRELDDNISRALEEAFNQGFALGDRQGYERGLNRGWAIEQDKILENRKTTLRRTI